MGLDFLILGVHRCGTTSLTDYLGAHPQVQLPRIKELNILNKEGLYSRGQSYYEAHINTLKPGLHFEGTVGYYEHYLVPFRVKRWYPDCKFIILFRDPVTRAYSAYWQTPAIDPYTKSASDFAERVRVALKKEYQTGFLERGKYWMPLAHWWELFPKERFLLIKSEDMFANPDKIYHEAQDFLGIERFSLEKYGKSYARAKGVMPEEIVGPLQKYFKPANDHFYTLTGIEWGY